ncbi:DUF456 family protein [Halorutilales archaeon Cl-col2-1]
MALGLEPLVLVAVVLAALGVFGSFLPLIPGAILSLSGVYIYWFSTGYSDPGLAVLALLTSVGLVVIAVDWFGGMFAAKVGGASTKLAAVAGVAGVVGLLTLGPAGVLVGSVGTVFVVEYRRSGDHRRSLRTAAYTTVGLLATNVVQAVLTFTILAGLVVVILV